MFAVLTAIEQRWCCERTVFSCYLRLVQMDKFRAVLRTSPFRRFGNWFWGDARQCRPAVEKVEVPSRSYWRLCVAVVWTAI